jgi:lysyl-tRNA synthetase class 1
VPPISFGLMMNLVGAANASTKDQLWGFISRYVPGATPESEPELDRLAGYAIAYYEDFVAPHKAYRLPNEQERRAMEDLRARLVALDEDTDGDTIQTEVFSAGKAAEFENLRDWFKALYECLLGQSQGPRMGGFFALYGLKNSIDMLDKVLNGEKLS